MRFIYLLLLLTCIACTSSDESQTSEQKVTTIQVDIDEAEPIGMSEYFSDINYFYLKSPEQRPIGRIRKIMFQDDYIALYDEARKSVWVYSEEGKYISEVDIPEGRGPGELSTLYDVVFTEDHKVHALGLYKIVVYNLEGQLNDEIEYEFLADSFTEKNNAQGYFIYANNIPNEGRGSYAGHNLISVDNSGNPVKSYLPIQDGKEAISFGVPNSFPRYNDQQLFFAHLVDTIYSISGEQISPKYALDYGKYAIPDDVFDRRDSYSQAKSFWGEFMEKEIEDKDYVYSLSYFNETDHFLHFRIGTGSNKYVVVHNKSTGSTKVSPDKLHNDIDYGRLPYIFFAHDNALYTVMESNNLIRHLNNMYENEREKYQSSEMKELKALSDTIDERSNPILIEIPFKETK